MALILFFYLKYGGMFDDKYSHVIGWIRRTYLPLHFMLLHINVHRDGKDFTRLIFLSYNFYYDNERNVELC